MTNLKEKTNILKQLIQFNRIQILLLLAKEDTCVCQMVKKLELPHNLISHHLKKLQSLGIARNTRNGVHQMYSLEEKRKDLVEEIIKLIRKV